MWSANTVSVPRELARLELLGQVPVGSTLAALVFLTSNSDPQTVMKNYPTISTEAEDAAWVFLNGIGTAPTEKTPSVPEVASPSTPISGSPSVTITPTGEFAKSVRAVQGEHFSGSVPITDEQLVDLARETDSDIAWITDIFTVMKDTNETRKPVTDPIRFLFYFVRKVERHDVGNQATRIRQQVPTRISVLDKARASAATKLNDLPPPGPKDDSAARMRELRKKAEALGNAE